MPCTQVSGIGSHDSGRGRQLTDKTERQDQCTHRPPLQRIGCFLDVGCGIVKVSLKLRLPPARWIGTKVLHARAIEVVVRVILR